MTHVSFSVDKSNLEPRSNGSSQCHTHKTTIVVIPLSRLAGDGYEAELRIELQRCDFEPPPLVHGTFSSHSLQQAGIYACRED